MSGQQFDHRSHPPATALGPDDPEAVDEDETGAITDDDEVLDDVQQLLAPGESPDDEAPAGS